LADFEMPALHATSMAKFKCDIIRSDGGHRKASISYNHLVHKTFHTTLCIAQET